MATLVQPTTGRSQDFTPDGADLQVCDLAASLRPAAFAGYLVSSAVFDIDNDDNPEHLLIGSEGTARSPSYRIERTDGTIVNLARPDGLSPEEDWNGTWGKRWLIHNGRSYAIRFSGRGTGYLNSISRIMPDFSERPICKFMPRVDVRIQPADAGDQDVCDAVRAGTVDYLPIAPIEAEEMPDQNIPGGNAYGVGQVHVDFMNNGQDELLLLINTASGAGSGCNLSYYDTMPDQAIGRDVLMAMQSVNRGDVYPSRTCHDDTPRWFAYGARLYLEIRSTGAENPSAEAMEYHWVDTIENDVARRVCEARFSHEQPEWIGVWSQSGWRPTAGNK